MVKPKKITEAEIKSGNRLISKFMLGRLAPTGKYMNAYHVSWNYLMPVRYKIQEILKIDGTSELIWWYSSKKTITYSKGAGGGGGWTDPRDPFDSIGGKIHSREIGVVDSSEKINRETEILATWDNIVYFIKWLNRVCPHLRNHVRIRKK